MTSVFLSPALYASAIDSAILSVCRVVPSSICSSPNTLFFLVLLLMCDEESMNFECSNYHSIERFKCFKCYLNSQRQTFFHAGGKKAIEIKWNPFLENYISWIAIGVWNSLLLLLQLKIKSLQAKEVSLIVSAKNGCPIYDPTSAVDRWTVSYKNTQTSSMD